MKRPTFIIPTIISESVCPIDMNYNWTNNAYWLLRLRLKPGAWADQQYSVGLSKNPTAAVHCAVLVRL